MTKILIADDNESLRSALKDILSSQEGWIICGEATNGQSAVKMAADLKPDLIILDFLMPLMNGLAAAAQISKELPAVPIVLFTMHMSAQLEREAKKAGVKKVISKTEPFNQFVASLEELARNKDHSLGPLGLDADLASSGNSADIPLKGTPRTPREPGENLPS